MEKRRLIAAIHQLRMVFGGNQCWRELPNIWKSASFQLVHTLLGSYFNRSMDKGSYPALRKTARTYPLGLRHFNKARREIIEGYSIFYSHPLLDSKCLPAPLKYLGSLKLILIFSQHLPAKCFSLKKYNEYVIYISKCPVVHLGLLSKRKSTKLSLTFISPPFMLQRNQKERKKKKITALEKGRSCSQMGRQDEEV